MGVKNSEEVTKTRQTEEEMSDELRQEAALSLFDEMIGDKIGYGMSRGVYNWNPDGSLVTKIELGEGKWFQNIVEWKIWEELQYHTILKEWLAPCTGISEDGKILWQKRTEKCLISKLPKYIPSCFTDEKASNWGMYKGKIVCHDYGTILFGGGFRMKKAEWTIDI